MLLIPIMLFVVGLVLLIKGGDWFVDGATGIAHRFKMSELLIGATVVSIGTTLPEVMVSATSAFQGYGDIAYGNAIGSIICNAALIAALTMAVRPSSVNRKLLVLPVVFFFGAVAIYISAVYFFGRFSRLIGVTLLLVFVTYTVVSILFANRVTDEVPETPEVETDPSAIDDPAKVRPLWAELIFLAVGGAAIAFGADLLVDNGRIIAEAIGIPEAVVALIFVSLGTSLPELVTAITALAKGHSALSLGNIIGANLLNLTLVTGVAATVQPFAPPVDNTVAGIPSSLVIDIPVMLLVMLILVVPTMLRNKASRVQGILLLSIYVAFCACSFIL